MEIWMSPTSKGKTNLYVLNFQEYVNSLSLIFQEYVNSLSLIFQEYVNSLSLIFQEYVNSLSLIFQEYVNSLSLSFKGKTNLYFLWKLGISGSPCASPLKKILIRFSFISQAHGDPDVPNL
jgi:predicted molibdopterin-dependent oxidoreductase YjgC